MRKELINRVIIAVSFTALLVFSLLILHQKGRATEVVRAGEVEDCSFYKEQEADNELLWEVLVRQFTGSVALN